MGREFSLPRFFAGVGLFVAVVFCASAAEPTSLEQAEGLFESGKADEARGLAERYVGSHPDDPEGLELLGRILLAQEEYDEALTQLQAAVDLDPKRASSHISLGEAYVEKLDTVSIFKKMGLAKKAKASFEKSVELDPASADARQALITYYLQAPGIAGGSTTKARENAQAMMAIDADSGHKLMAMVHEKLKEYDEAERMLRARIRLAREAAEPWYELGLYLQRRELFADALVAFDKAIDVAPEGHLNSLYQIGRTGALSGNNLDRAARALTAFLEQEEDEDAPSHAWANYRLGMVYDHGGDTARARSAYETALRLDPDNEPAQKALRKLK